MNIALTSQAILMFLFACLISIDHYSIRCPKMRGHHGPASAICYLSLKDLLRGMFKDLKKLFYIPTISLMQ
jgi:hypothetical protein